MELPSQAHDLDNLLMVMDSKGWHHNSLKYHYKDPCRECQ